MAKVEFRKLRQNYPVVIALVNGKPIAKASFYFASQKWLATSLGAGLIFKNKKRLSVFQTIDQAKKAITKAYEELGE